MQTFCTLFLHGGLNLTFGHEKARREGRAVVLLTVASRT